MTEALESLEPRTHLSVTTSPDGWTDITPSADTRTIFVSSSLGDDRNDGTSPNFPLRTLARGYEALRNGKPDHLLLRSGDVWNETFPKWRLSGRSEQEPILVGKYGPDDKPLILAGSGSGFRTAENVSHLTIVGLSFFAHTRDPYNTATFTGTAGGDGMAFLGDVHDLLIEDVTVDQFTKNIVFQPSYGRSDNVRIRRSVVTDAYNGSGIYINGVDGITIESSVFDHNGWNEIVDIPEQRTDHNIYFSADNSDVVVRDNLIVDGGMHGLQARAGGIIQNNLFVRNPIGMTFGIAGGAMSHVGGAFGEVSGNVFLGGRDVRGEGRGWAIELGNLRPGGNTLVKDNLIAHDAQNLFPAIQLNIGKDIKNPQDTVGLHDVNLVGNIVYDWFAGLSTTNRFINGGTDLNGYSGVLVRNNDFQRMTSGRAIVHRQSVDLSLEKWEGNRYFAEDDDVKFQNGQVQQSYGDWRRFIDPSSAFTEVEYFAPDRTFESYSVSLGHRNRVGALVSEMRHQSRNYWREEYTTAAALKYVRDGFVAVKGPPRLLTTNLSSRDLSGARRSISFGFSRDVSDSIDVTDLKIWSRAGDRVIDASEMSMTYDRLTHVAMWTFPGMKRGMLWAGDWAVHLHAPGIKGDGMQLDTDWDGQGGDSYQLKFTLPELV
jgi:hypothetical protein